MIHRALLGSLERFFGILIEHYSGKFPFWLSPIQYKIITIKDTATIMSFATELQNKLRQQGFRGEIDNRNESMGKKARDAQIQRYNYLVTVGKKEVEEKRIAVKVRDGKEIVSYDVDEFVSKLKEEIVSRKR